MGKERDVTNPCQVLFLKTKRLPRVCVHLSRTHVDMWIHDSSTQKRHILGGSEDPADQPDL